MKSSKFQVPSSRWVQAFELVLWLLLLFPLSAGAQDRVPLTAASQAEVTAGTSTTKGVTPATLAARLTASTNAVLNMTLKTGNGGGSATNAVPNFTGQIGISDYGAANSKYLWESTGPLAGQWSQSFSWDYSAPAFFGGLNTMPYTPVGPQWSFWVNGNFGNQTNNDIANNSDVVAAFYNGNLWKYSQISVIGVVTNSVSGGVQKDLSNWASFGSGNPLSIEAFAGLSWIVVIKQPFAICQTASVGTNGITGEPSSSLDTVPDHQVTTWDFQNGVIHFGHLTNGVYSYTNANWIDAFKMDYVKDTFTVRSNVVAQTVIASNVNVHATSDAVTGFNVFKANGGRVGAMGLQFSGSLNSSLWLGDIVPASGNYTLTEDNSTFTRMNDPNNTVIQFYLGNSTHVADMNSGGLDVFAGGVTFENTTHPTVTVNQVAIWNSNKVLYAVSATKTNLISDLR